MIITGTDEVGRGCIAGPIVAASVGLSPVQLNKFKSQVEAYLKETESVLVLKRLNRTKKLIDHDINLINKHSTNLEITQAANKIDKVRLKQKEIQYTNIRNILQFIYDSKKISEKHRISITNFLLNKAKFGLGVVSSSEIDKQGIQYANVKSMKKSLNNLQYCNSTVTVLHLFDHLDPLNLKGSHKKSIGITKGDQNSFVIACASILAKTYRDNIMQQYAKNYPNYGFDKHVGYGTKKHIEAINKYGTSKIHRTSYKIFDNVR